MALQRPLTTDLYSSTPLTPDQWLSFGDWPRRIRRVRPLGNDWYRVTFYR